MMFLELTIGWLETFMFTIIIPLGIYHFNGIIYLERVYNPDEIRYSELRMWSQPLKARMCPHTSTIDVFRQEQQLNTCSGCTHEFLHHSQENINPHIIYLDSVQCFLLIAVYWHHIV